MPLTRLEFSQVEDSEFASQDELDERPTKDPVISDSRIDPPGMLIVGDRYIIAGTGGAWSGFAVGDIVEVTESYTWDNYTPEEGDHVYIRALDKYKAWTGSAWAAPPGSVTALSELVDVGSATPGYGHILIANGTLFNSAQHRGIDELVHVIAENSFLEIARTSGRITSLIWWTDELKTTKIRQVDVSRTDGRVTQMTTTQYKGGIPEYTYTEAINRSGGRIVSINGVLV